jgi:transcriptional regulator with XRE-family HTH domain
MMAKRRKQESWPSRLKRIRAERGLTVEQAAALIGVARSTWYGWETPSQLRWPSPSHAILIELLEQGKLR